MATGETGERNENLKIYYSCINGITISETS